TDEVHDEERGEVRGEGAERQEQRDEERVEAAAAPPRGDRADRGAEDEREDEGDTHERDRVRKRAADDARHLGRIVRGRDAEVEMRDAAEVLPVRGGDRLVVAAEELL